MIFSRSLWNIEKGEKDELPSESLHAGESLGTFLLQFRSANCINILNIFKLYMFFVIKGHKSTIDFINIRRVQTKKDVNINAKDFHLDNKIEAYGC